MCIKTEGGNVRMITLQLYNQQLLPSPKNQANQPTNQKKQHCKKHQYALNIKRKRDERGREGRGKIPQSKAESFSPNFLRK